VTVQEPEPPPPLDCDNARGLATWQVDTHGVPQRNDVYFRIQFSTRQLKPQQQNLRHSTPRLTRVFTVKFRKDLRRKHLPSNMLPHYLAKRKCLPTAQLIQFKMMRRRLITVNVHDGRYFFDNTD